QNLCADMFTPLASRRHWPIVTEPRQIAGELCIKLRSQIRVEPDQYGMRRACRSGHQISLSWSAMWRYQSEVTVHGAASRFDPVDGIVNSDIDHCIEPCGLSVTGIFRSRGGQRQLIPVAYDCRAGIDGRVCLTLYPAKRHQESQRKNYSGTANYRSHSCSPS